MHTHENSNTHKQRTIEAVDLGDLPGLVVAAEQSDLVRVAGLQNEQVRERLQTVVPPVHKIPLRKKNRWERKLNE